MIHCLILNSIQRLMNKTLCLRSIAFCMLTSAAKIVFYFILFSELLLQNVVFVNKKYQSDFIMSPNNNNSFLKLPYINIPRQVKHENALLRPRSYFVLNIRILLISYYHRYTDPVATF